MELVIVAVALVAIAVLIAASRPATAPERTTTPWVASGVSYCTVHDGIANEDDDRCDFSRDDRKDRPCERRPLYYTTKESA